ncbi:MAG: Cytochrome oxidase, cbb3-type, subunit [Bacteroidota bacterium]|nr:Cytochrome oxidase, cbb3-type, subunit [Bacteroidota bacterium]
MKRAGVSFVGFFFVVILVTRCDRPRPATENSPELGARLFVQYCAPCHQGNGIGGPAPGGGLNAPDIRQFTKSPAELEVIIKNGFGKMPSFKDSTTAENIAIITNYVATNVELHR